MTGPVAVENIKANDDVTCVSFVAEPLLRYYLRGLRSIPPSTKIDYLYNCLNISSKASQKYTFIIRHIYQIKNCFFFVSKIESENRPV